MSETDEDAEWDAEYERKRRLLCEIFGDDPDAPQPPERPSNTVPLFPLAKIWPDFGGKLEDLLTRKGEHLLASTIDDLWVYDRCTCGAAYCATVYTQPRPERGYGPTHRNVSFWPPNMVNLDTQRTVVEEHPGAVMAEHLTVLDVVDDRIACIEVMYAQDLHDRRDEKIAARIAKDRAAWRNEGYSDPASTEELLDIDRLRVSPVDIRLIAYCARPHHLLERGPEVPDDLDVLGRDLTSGEDVAEGGLDCVAHRLGDFLARKKSGAGNEPVDGC